jgi:hypothetical protein
METLLQQTLAAAGLPADPGRVELDADGPDSSSDSCAEPHFQSTGIFGCQQGITRTETIQQESGRPHFKLRDTVNPERDGIRWWEDWHENAHQGDVAGFARH